MGHSPCKIVSLGQKLKKAWSCQKRLYDHIKLVPSIKPLQKAPNIRKMTAFLKWPKLATMQKMVSLGQKLKMPKRCEKQLYDHIKHVVYKKPLLKHLIFEKWQHFENGQNWPRCLGYSPCKMVSLAQKLKMRLRWQKRLYDHIKLVTSKKPLQKTPNIRKMTAFWKWPKLATMRGL